MSDKTRPYKILVASSVFVPLLLFLVIMWYDYRLVIRETRREVDGMAEIFQQHALNVFESHHLVCERVNERLRGMSWKEIRQSGTIRTYLGRICADYPQVHAIWLIDPEGTIRNASQPLPARRISVADRDYFRALRAVDSDLFVGHSVEGRVMKGLNFNLAHRRSGNGSFDGLIVVTVFPEYFSNFWNKTIQDNRNAAALFRSDGMMLARAPHLKPEFLKLPPSSPVMQAIRGRDGGSFFGVSANDGLDRYYSFRKVGRYNAYMIYGVSTVTTFREWLRHLYFYGSILTAATLSLLLLALVVQKRARLQLQAEQALNAAYDELENRVSERTAELHQANRELTEEIRERERAEEALRENITEYRRAREEREQYFKFFRVATDLMCIADPTGCFKKVNPACVQVLGYSEAELLAKPFIEFVHPEDRQATLDEMARQMKIGFSLNFENRFLCKDGSERWLSWRANYVASELITYATARDVTEWKMAEAQIHALNEELELRVKQRTSELEVMNQELKRLNRLYVGRELRMLELKDRIKELELKSGGTR